MTNFDVYKGFSQYLDGRFLLNKDTSNKDEMLNDYLNMVGLNRLILLSAETTWFCNAAFDKHIERINTASQHETTTQYFGVKPEGITDATYRNAYILPRSAAIKAYNDILQSNSDAVLRDVDPDSHFIRVESVEENDNGQCDVTLHIFAADNFSHTVGLHRYTTDSIRSLLFNAGTQSVTNIKLENRIGEYDNPIPVLTFTADTFSLEQDYIIGKRNGEKLFLVEPYEAPALLSPQYDEHTYDETQHTNPHRPVYDYNSLPATKDIVDDDFIDEEIDELFNIDDISESLTGNADINPVHDTSPASTSDTNAAPTESELNVHDVPVQDNLTDSFDVALEDDKMNKELFTVEGLSDDLDDNAFAYALNEMFESGALERKRRIDTLDFLVQQGYQFNAHYLSNEQNKLLQNIYQHFITNLDNKLAAQQASDANEQDKSSANEATESVDNTQPAEEVVAEAQVEDVEPVENANVDTEQAEAEDDTATSTENVSQENVQDSKPVEKTEFMVPGLDLDNMSDMPFAHWLTNARNDGRLAENWMVNVGHFLKDIGFDQQLHTYSRSQVLQLKKIHDAFDEGALAVGKPDEAPEESIQSSAGGDQQISEPTQNESNEVQTELTIDDDHNDNSIDQPSDSDAQENIVTDTKDDNETADEHQSETLSTDRPSIAHQILNSFRCAASIGLFSGEFENDVKYCLNSAHANVSLDCFSDKQVKIIRDLHTEACEQILDVNENIDDIVNQQFYSLSTEVNGEFQTVHFADSEQTTTLADIYYEHGYQSDIIPIPANKITARVEDIYTTSTEDIAVVVALHGPVNAANIEALASINNALGDELKDNCENIKGVKVYDAMSSSQVLVPVIELYCDSTDFIPHTLLRPEHDPTKDLISVIAANSSKNVDPTPTIATVTEAPPAETEAPQTEMVNDSVKELMADASEITSDVENAYDEEASHSDEVDAAVSDDVDESMGETLAVTGDIEIGSNDSSETPPANDSGFNDDEIDILDSYLDNMAL